MLGSGILKGLAVTAKNFIGSYHDPARMVTEQYPEERPKLPEAYRNFPFLVSENATDPMGTLRCVACQICEKECPPQCIYIEKSKDKKPDATGKMQIYPTVFAIDTSVCMSCQLCVEVCPFDAIKMDHVFEVATNERSTPCSSTASNWPSPIRISMPSARPRPPRSMTASPRNAKPPREKAKAAAAAKAAAPTKPAAPAPVAGVADPGPASPRPATNRPPGETGAAPGGPAP